MSVRMRRTQCSGKLDYVSASFAIFSPQPASLVDQSINSHLEYRWCRGTVEKGSESDTAGYWLAGRATTRMNLVGAP